MDLVLNRPHSKANELMVGTGKPWRLLTLAGASFGVPTRNKKTSARYQMAPPASCALGRVA
jgi:hypothetical protein